MRFRGFRSSISMRTEWIVILTIYAVVLPVLTGWATLRVTKQTIQTDTMASLSGSMRAFSDAIDTQMSHHRERMRSVLRLVDTACAVSGAVNEDCVQDEVKVLLDEGASAATLRYQRRRKWQGVDSGPRTVASCNSETCLWHDDRLNHSYYSMSESDPRTGMVLNVAWRLEPLLESNLEPGDQAAIVAWPGKKPQVIGRSDALALIPHAELASCFSDNRRSRAADSSSYRVVQPLESLPGVCGASFVKADSVVKAERLRSELLKIVFVFITASLLLALGISFTTTRALRELRDRMKQMRVGKSVIRRRRRGPAEVRELSITFDRLMHSLRRSQRALIESEQKLSMAYHAASIVVWEHYIDDGRILVRNPSSEQPTTTFTLREFLRSVHPDDRHSVLAAIRVAMQTGTYAAEYRTRRGNEFLWASSWGQMIEGGKVLMGVTADVTTMKEGERLRSERERLVATSEMSASLAHEINNPLAAVTGSLYMADRCDPSDEELKHYLHIASVESARIAEIVRRLLQLHRTSSAPVNFDVVKLWTDLIEGSAERLNKNGNIVELDATGPAPVVGYPDELRHGFSNLLTNAVESSQRGESIRVRIRPTYSLKSGVRGVRVLLCDFGKGMPEERLEDMFKPFVSTKREKGRGLGLWVVRAAVLKQGGDIRIRAMRIPRRGTCVRIFLPNRPAGLAA